VRQAARYQVRKAHHRDNDAIRHRGGPYGRALLLAGGSRSRQRVIGLLLLLRRLILGLLLLIRHRDGYRVGLRGKESKPKS
jgi:hypothetical protein